MKFIERKQKLEYLLVIIEKGWCLSLDQVSIKFDCSKRTIRRMIEELREDGHDIRYCKTNQKFYKEF